MFFFQLFAGYLMRKGKKKITKAIRGWGSVKLLQGTKKKKKISKFPVDFFPFRGT